MTKEEKKALQQKLKSLKSRVDGYLGVGKRSIVSRKRGISVDISGAEIGVWIHLLDENTYSFVVDAYFLGKTQTWEDILDVCNQLWTEINKYDEEKAND